MLWPSSDKVLINITSNNMVPIRRGFTNITANAMTLILVKSYTLTSMAKQDAVDWLTKWVSRHHQSISIKPVLNH